LKKRGTIIAETQWGWLIIRFSAGLAVFRMVGAARNEVVNKYVTDYLRTPVPQHGARSVFTRSRCFLMISF
jgi:hypothetical protein